MDKSVRDFNVRLRTIRIRELIVGIIIAGIITAAAGRNLVAIIAGVCLVGLGVYLLVKMKDFPTMDIYEKALVLYTSPESKKVVRIPYEDINQWSIENKEGQMSAIKLIMNSGLTVYQPTFQLDKAARHLSQLIYEKETRIINKKEALKKKLELPRFLRNIIKK